MQTRKGFALLTGIWLLSFAKAAPIVFRSTDGQTMVTYRGIQWVQINPTKSRYLFTGGVEAKFLKTGVTILADHATAYAQTLGGKTEVISITAIKNVRLVKTDKKTGGPRTDTLACDHLDFFNDRGSSSAVCKGSVVLTETDSAKHLTMRATGSTGKATFAGGADMKNNRMTSATLYSPVDIQINQAPTDGKKADRAHITCSQMVYKPTPTSGTLELSGNIHMTSAQGSVSNLSRGLIHLNAQGEVQDFEGSGDH